MKTLSDFSLYDRTVLKQLYAYLEFTESIDCLENIMSALHSHFPVLTRLYWLQILSD